MRTIKTILETVDNKEKIIEMLSIQQFFGTTIKNDLLVTPEERIDYFLKNDRVLIEKFTNDKNKGDFLIIHGYNEIGNIKIHWIDNKNNFILNALNIEKIKFEINEITKNEHIRLNKNIFSVIEYIVIAVMYYGKKEFV